MDASPVSATNKGSSDWANLPADLLSLIIAKIGPSADVPRVASICQSWHSIVKQTENPTWKKFPWLLLSEEDYPGNGKTRSFWCPTDRRVYELPLPQACRRRCVGSTDGWLVMLGEAIKGQELHILNPITRAQFPLPPQSTLKRGNRWRSAMKKYSEFIQRISLSCSPLKKGGDCIALATYDGREKLAYARPGDEKWTPIHSELWPFANAVWYKGEFYAVSWNGQVVRCDIPERGSKTVPKAVQIAPEPPTTEWVWGTFCYIVESGGSLLQILRARINLGEKEENSDIELTETIKFHVFKLDEKRGEWEKIESLGDRALFVGLGTSVSVCASEYVGVRENCIYFTDDYCLERICSHSSGGRGGGWDIGMYSLEDERIYQNYSYDPRFPFSPVLVDSRSPFSPPLWVMPSLD